MTYQIEDRFRYGGEEYTLTACSAGEPFNPMRLGIRTDMASTACWRGYLNTYGVLDGRLVVADLRLQLFEEGEGYVRVPGPILNGVQPVEEAPGIDWFNNNYVDLDLPLEYDGGLIVGKDFVEKYFADLDWITCWKYGRVVELWFEAGRLTRERDLSAHMLPIQEYADRQHADLTARFDRLREALQGVESDEERTEIKRRVFSEARDPDLEAETDDVAREVLSGVIDAGYLSRSDPG